MPTSRDGSLWKWAFVALMAVAGVLLVPSFSSLSPQADAPGQAAAATAMSGGGIEKIADSIDQKISSEVARVEQDLKDKMGSLVEKKLKEMEAKLTRKLGEHIDQQLDQSSGTARQTGAAPDIESMRSEIDSMIEKKLGDKLDRRIDFRISKQGGGKPAPAPPPPPAPDPPPPPPEEENEEDHDDTSAVQPKFNGHSVTGVHKEWCGINDGRKCMDKWEKSYMEENEGKLKKAFKILRKPGCFPHGVSVASMGYFRTGSTLLYNTARLWLALGAGESLVAGFMCKDPKLVGIGVKGAPQEHCSMLCKDHEMKSGIDKNAKVLLMSRRDPYYSVCSRKLMDVWCRMKSRGPGPVDWDAIKAYAKKCKETPEIEKQEAIDQCRGLMKMQADIYFARQQAGKSVAFDQLMEEYESDPATQVREIALAIGICREAATHEDLVKFIVQMGKELKEHPDQSMDITQMHDVHTPEQRKAKCSNLEGWMRSDSICRAWMDANANASANGVLHKMTKDHR